MAYAIPTTGYVTSYGLLTLHDGSNKFASSTIKEVVKALDQSVVLADGRVLDLALGGNTIWVPIEFKQRYVITSGGVAWMTSINEYIDNDAEDTITIKAANAASTWSATGRIVKPCVEVTPIQPNSGGVVEIELTFKASSDWS